MPSPTPFVRPRQGRVLVVDRDAHAGAALRLIVEYDGHEVRQTAAHGEALTLLEQFLPHVVLLDPAVPTAAAPRGSEAVVQQARFACASVILTSPPTGRFDRRLLRWIAAHVSRPFDFVELRLLVSREVTRASAA